MKNISSAFANSLLNRVSKIASEKSLERITKERNKAIKVAKQWKLDVASWLSTTSNRKNQKANAARYASGVETFPLRETGRLIKATRYRTSRIKKGARKGSYYSQQYAGL